MRTITKEAETTSAAAPLAPEDLAAINRLSRRELKAEEVYAFAVRLCAHHTHRDDEYFDRRAL